MRSQRRWWLSGLVALAAGAALTPGPVAVSARAGDGEKPRAKVKASDDVDEMLREAWAGAGVKPSRVAPDAEFLRRAYLDLLGRIPNVQEALAFLESKEKGKRAKLVEYLLAHPDYAKNFANVWTVTLIGRQNQGRNVDRAALSGWLRQQFAQDRPWDEMAYELIDAKGSNKENGAANFALAHLEFGAVPLTSITTRVFLGQQIQCTQCHDHPSNDWKQKDFWGINAFFKGLRSRTVRKPDATGAEVDAYIELYDEPSDAYASFERRNGLMEIAFPTFLDGRKVGQGRDVDRRKALAEFVTGSDNADFPRAFVNRMWAHFLGRGFVHPVDDFGPHNPPSMPELLDRLAEDFQASGYDVKALIRRITSSQAYHQTSASTKDNEKDDVLFSHMALKPMTPEQLFDSLIVATSAHKAGGAGDTEGRRSRWMQQFVTAFANDEGDEATNFQGTIPQALMMMNGELMTQAVGCKPGSFLADVLDQSRLQDRDPAPYIIDRLFLAALSRFPTPRELAAAREFLGTDPNPVAVMEDLFWSLLNSNEFVLNR